MNFNKKLIIMLGLGVATGAYSQDLTNIRPVLTGAPFLRIAPDARSGGMADQGVLLRQTHIPNIGTLRNTLLLKQKHLWVLVLLHI